MLTPDQKKMQLDFDELPPTVGVIALMVVSSLVVVPAILLFEKINIIKKIRCPNH